MRMAHKRNEPCPCGSGKKYKVCCAGKRSSSQWLALVSVVIFAGLAAWVVAGVFRQAAEPNAAAPPGKIWSEEHGHWHDAPGSPGDGPPVGPTPPGKEWSYEHGHWHDAAVPGLGRPPGPAPPGKVWDAGHGHWHDADGSEPAEDPTALAEDGVSYSEE
jgi:ABC-type nickel/cobalt efflux system permease component RcnA